MSPDAKTRQLAELRRLEQMPPMSAESTVSRNYLDWMLAVPWKKKIEGDPRPPVCRTGAESDHYGLEKIKERILEFLAVRRLVKNPKGSILCFVGTSGRGQDLAGDVNREGDGAAVCAAVAGRRPGRGRGPRPPADVHWRAAGSDLQMMKKAGNAEPGVHAR
jgi:ATP-dependent Lon protease